MLEMLRKLLARSSRHLPPHHITRSTACLSVQSVPLRHICSARPLWTGGRPNQDHEQHLNVGRVTAVQQLRELYSGSLLEQPFRDTEAYRKRARRANLDVQLVNAIPWVDLGKHILPSEDGVDYARETLERFHAWTATLNPEDAQAEIEKVSIGRQTLDWLPNVDDETRRSCGVDFRLLRLLAHFIVAEGQEEHLWKWIHREMGSIGPIRDVPARARIE